MPDDTTPILTRKVFEPVETHFTPGERSMVAWISTDAIDHERDVVVSSGIDYKSYFLGETPEDGNPCVLAFHDYGRWPLGRCEWIKAKQSRNFNGLYAKTIFDDDPETEAVWRKIKSRSLRGVSIGFRPPDDLKPGEWGPPTPEELRRRPDWKGAERVIRRCVMLEYSVCSLPMNPQALVAAVNKGVHRPVYSSPKVTMDEPIETPAEATAIKPETKAAKPVMPTHDEPDGDEAPCVCGKADCAKCSETAKADDEPDADDMEPKAIEPVMHEEPDGDEVVEPDGDEVEADADDEGEPEEIGPLKRYDPVSIKSPHYKGFGRVESLHTKGHVPHASNHMMGTKDDPAACIKCYRKMGDGHVATDDHVAVKVAHLTKLASPFKAPTKKAVSTIEVKTTPRTTPEYEPMPRIVAQSDQEVRDQLIAELEKMLSPEGFRKIAREEAERAAGYV